MAQEASRFVVGIDLGTTNSAVCYIDTADARWQIHTLAIPQVVAPSEVEARDTLPSFHYEAAAGEFSKGALRLPWDTTDQRYTVGVFARDHGTTVPGRMIASVKSWLCHSGVDRTAAILPWHGTSDVERLSPVAVSSRYLAHIAAAWDTRFPEHPLHRQEVTLTVPASFDEVARQLTVAAAQQAGLQHLVLLEEPQAALYAWVYAHEDDWHTLVQPGLTILVCDIGGGTTDFTLIRVCDGSSEHNAADGKLQLQRIAVGDHLILGGDNLDLALAHLLEPRLTASATSKLSPRQWDTLVRVCCHVKETFLGAKPPDRLTVSVPGDGARLIGGALHTDVQRQEVEDLLLEGFLPYVERDARPHRYQSGFQEFGLPYAPDPAITAYLAAFLSDHQQLPAAGDNGTSSRPDAILLNGGLFASSLVRQRLLDMITAWYSSTDSSDTWQPLVLHNARLDLAVAQGAAYYGMVRRGHGTRIAGGLARAHYIGVEGEAPEVAEHAAMCLLPAGIAAGQMVELTDRQFQLRIRQPVEFPLYTSSLRTADTPGTLVPIDPQLLRPLPPIRTVLTSGRRKSQAEIIPVTLHAQLSEIGTLELWCREASGDRQWQLQFDVRAAAGTRVAETPRAASGATGEDVLDASTLAVCGRLIHETFTSTKPGTEPEGLMKRLEQVTEMPRTAWPSTVLRRFWEAQMAVVAGRQLSPTHEARWLNLAGFALRPGYGMALDDWRVAQTWRMLQGRLQHPRHEMCRTEWWILWRRIAGGLEPGQQKMLAEPLMAALRARWSALAAQQSGRRLARSGKASGGEFRFGSNEYAEVWRLLGSLELLDVGLKIELGQLAFDLGLRKGLEAVREASAWALGRLGTRVPVYGPLNTLVPVEIAEAWTQRLLTLDADPAVVRRAGELPQSAIFVGVQLTRRTGDRYRDVSDKLRDAVQQWLGKRQAPKHFATLVGEGGDLHEDEQVLVFSESVLPGLKIA
jgi:molecular chaperone DnaK (HSP70)